MAATPTTLMEAVRYFSDDMTCINYVASRRWPNGAVCPVCGAETVTWLPSVKRWQCSKRHPKRQFTAKTGSIFEDSPLPLDKWLVAMWLITNAKNGISSYEIHRAIGVTQKTAWFMLHRIRLAMQQESLEKMGGKDGVEVEVDETFIGANARNMHQTVRDAKGIKQGSQSHRSVVLGIMERDGNVRTFHVEDRKANSLVPLLRKHVKEDSWLYTDANPAYVMLPDWFRHDMVDHAVEYVNGRISTNCMENYWSLLKRTIRGTYVSVEPFHLHRYLDEQAFRFNTRKGKDQDRFKKLAGQVSGKRLTYKKLTGKEEVPASV